LPYAYDYSTRALVDEAGIDMVLVGDSLAQAMLGYENTLSVTVDEMLHHVKAVDAESTMRCCGGHAVRFVSGGSRRCGA